MAQDAVQILLDHIQDVLAAFHGAGGDARQAHATLAEKIPAFQGMEWNTFRTRVRVVVAAWQAGHAHGADTVRALEQEIAGLREELETAKADMVRYFSALQSQIQADIKAADGKSVAGMDIPKTMEGWSLNQHARGFWRAFRKVNGKSRCVYLGIKFDHLAARDKLVAANARLVGSKEEGNDGNPS